MRSPLRESPAPIRAVLFDVYGTLVQIENPKHPYRQMLDVVRRQHPTITKEQCARDLMCQPLGLAGVARFYGVQLSPAQQRELQADLDEEIRSLRLFPEVRSVLGTLRDRGYRLGVCSNLAEPYVRPAAQLLGRMIDVAVWSCEVGAMKPDAAIYESATSRLGVAPESVLMVGDSYSADVEGPRLARLQAQHLDRRSGAGELTTLEGLLTRLK